MNTIETDNAIYFYTQRDTYGFLSNFYATDFVDDTGQTFNCSEQYFMYMKCITFDPDNQELLSNILRETSATKIKKYGRSVNHYNDKVWNSKREDIMYDALLYKFTQNDQIKHKLLQTGSKHLYESAKNDKIWGIGYYAKDAVHKDVSTYGRNLLGILLMKVRHTINDNT